MNKKLALITLFIFVLVLSSNIVYAQNMFQDVIELLNDVFKGISKIFTLPLFRTPWGAFGFLLFLIWVMLLAILIFATERAFRGMHKRQKVVISVVIATMCVILLNFQRAFMYKILGNWLIWLYFILVFGVVGVLVYVAAKHSNWNPWVRALIYFLALMITLAADDDLVPYLDALERAIRDYVWIFPLHYYLKKSLEKWQQQ